MRGANAISNGRPIAPVGQELSHSSQKLQASGRTIAAVPLRTDTACVGQICSHIPQPVHRRRSTRGINILLLTAFIVYSFNHLLSKMSIPTRSCNTCDICHIIRLSGGVFTVGEEVIHDELLLSGDGISARNGRQFLTNYGADRRNHASKSVSRGGLRLSRHEVRWCRGIVRRSEWNAMETC